MEHTDITTPLLFEHVESRESRYSRSLPNYTSPPLPEALAATPIEFQNDSAVKAAQALDDEGKCLTSDPRKCQILFPPSQTAIDSGTTKLGVLFYGGALVDPRAYSLVARALSEEHGIAVSIPIFHRDVSYLTGDSCNSGRLPLAAAAFPYVEKWVLAGHSIGGISAQNDFWTMMQNDTHTDLLGGLVLVGSYLRQDVCGAIDFSDTSIPMATVQASLDLNLNRKNMMAGSRLCPPNTTMHVNIIGGNHGQFGSYDYSERETLLHKFDGVPTIPAKVQREWTISAILQVCSQVGFDLPTWENGDMAMCLDGIDVDSDTNNMIWSTTSHDGGRVLFVIAIVSVLLLGSWITHFCRHKSRYTAIR